MISIRLRLFLLLCILTGKALGLTFFTYKTFNEFQSNRKQLDLSYSVRDKAQNLEELKPGSEKLKELGASAAKMFPPRRAEELTTLVQTLNLGQGLRDRHQIFLKNEAEFQRYTRDHLDFLETRLFYFGAMALLTLCFGFFALQWFLQRSVIRPLRDLSRKMVDFLHDRYTYQFSVPSLDEIGHMQSTFNSLAQRVISNMEQLRTLDQAKSEFLSIASHELRTPLTSIKGSLGLLRSGVVGPMNEMVENLLGIAENETDRLIRLINDILDLAKIEARKLPLNQDWKPFAELVNTSLQGLQGLATQAKVSLKAEPMPPLDSYMDADRIQQVLTNLLSNAIKFSPEGSSVVVRCTINEESALLIEVKDSGRGIDPADQEAIFEKFRQASNSRNPLVKGTGLGLAIAKALVEQHGGEIGVSSVPGEGSTFFFTLPEWRYTAKNIVEVSA